MPIYKILPRTLWQEAQMKGVFSGAPVDLADGYIHFSTAAQVRETAAKHFAAQDDLLLLTINDQALGPALIYEPSRGGDLFPHLYGPMPLDKVIAIHELKRGDDGLHIFPEEIL